MKTYHPLNTPKPVAPNIWVIDGEIIHMKFLFLKVPFPTRMTVIKLPGGKLWCHSPIALTPELAKAIDRLGEVAYLISPNKLHKAYIDQWQQHYPQATIYARDLADNPPPEWSQDIDQLLFKGSPIIEEAVFFHKSSHTLILTDLIENFNRSKFRAGFGALSTKSLGFPTQMGKRHLTLDYRSPIKSRRGNATRKCWHGSRKRWFSATVGGTMRTVPRSWNAHSDG